MGHIVRVLLHPKRHGDTGNCYLRFLRGRGHGREKLSTPRCALSRGTYPIVVAIILSGCVVIKGVNFHREKKRKRTKRKRTLFCCCGSIRLLARWAIGKRQAGLAEEDVQADRLVRWIRRRLESRVTRIKHGRKRKRKINYGDHIFT